MNGGERKTFNILVYLGIPFYCQQPLGPYFADFVGADRNFVLEIDGSSHLGHEEYDEARDQQFARWGFDTYRLWSMEINEENITTIITQAEVIGREEVDRRIAKAQTI